MALNRQERLKISIERIQSLTVASPRNLSREQEPLEKSDNVYSDTNGLQMIDFTEESVLYFLT